MIWRTRKDSHDYMTEEHVARFLRNDGTGVDNNGRKFLGKIIAEYDNPTVLDVACGSAVNYETFKLAGVKCQYTGLDRTKKMLAEAKKRYGTEIELIEGYAEELPFPDKSVDIVICRHICEHLAEGYETVIKEALRVANKEVIIVFFICPGNDEEDKIDESQPDENGTTFFMNTYSWPKLANFLAEQGVIIKRNTVWTPGAAHADYIIRCCL